jgi:hypothetical protein
MGPFLAPWPSFDPSELPSFGPFGQTDAPMDFRRTDEILAFVSYAEVTISDVDAS